MTTGAGMKKSDHDLSLQRRNVHCLTLQLTRDGKANDKEPYATHPILRSVGFMDRLQRIKVSTKLLIEYFGSSVHFAGASTL